MRNLLAALTLALFTACGAGDGPGPLPYADYASGVVGLALSSDRTTNEVNVGGYNQLSVITALTDANTSVTSINVTCAVSNDALIWGFLTAKNVQADGVSLSKKYVDQQPHAGTTTYTARFGIIEQYARCTIHGNGVVTAVDDVITVSLRAGVL